MTLSDLGTAVVVGRPWPVEDVSDRSLPTRGFLPRTPQLGLAAPLLIRATVRPLEPMSILALPNACCCWKRLDAIDEISQSREQLKAGGDRWNEPGSATVARFE